MFPIGDGFNCMTESTIHDLLPYFLNLSHAQDTKSTITNQLQSFTTVNDLLSTYTSESFGKIREDLQSSTDTLLPLIDRLKQNISNSSHSHSHLKEISSRLLLQYIKNSLMKITDEVKEDKCNYRSKTAKTTAATALTDDEYFSQCRETAAFSNTGTIESIYDMPTPKFADLKVNQGNSTTTVSTFTASMSKFAMNGIKEDENDYSKESIIKLLNYINEMYKRQLIFADKRTTLKEMIIQKNKDLFSVLNLSLSKEEIYYEILNVLNMNN